jgi:hypothetical protein
VPSVSGMPVNTMSFMCQVSAVCLSIQCHLCAKCERYACQYNVIYVPSVSSMPVNTMADMCQVWAICLSIQCHLCAKCERYACQYNGSHVPSVSGMTVNTMADMCQVWAVCLLSMLGPLLLKSKAWMCLSHTQCLDSTFQRKNTASIHWLNNFHQNIRRLQSKSGVNQ